MRGGYFDYSQYRIFDIVETMKSIVGREEELPWENRQYGTDTLEEFKKGVKILEQAAVYAQRFDWLLSGDDGENTFHKRLKEDLERVKC